jgi:hemerythrin-like domain-containing protein
MLPAGPLMIEHRLIERMIKVMKGELENMRNQNKANVVFIDTAVDFIKAYADRCHHGKEEDILFKKLAAKKLSPEHKKILNELIEEHAHGRVTTSNLVIAKEKYAQGAKSALPDIIKSIEELTVFYPKHIEKEDKRFFLPCMDYFSQKEQQDMLSEFWEFDKKLIHEKYKKVVEKSEK